mmetsp:Transcript_64497/g.115998  ORF Transcript_64497/g.115998 Transcript_64497/m.115998 type:complete len:170 (+) Transcript_64497:44-553(+)
MCQPENFITWGGSLLPRIETLEPRIRETALNRFYIPKLVSEGFTNPEIISRVEHAATIGMPPAHPIHRGKHKGHASSASALAMMANPSLASGMSHSRSLPSLARPNPPVFNHLVLSGPDRLPFAGHLPSVRTPSMHRNGSGRLQLQPFIAGPEQKWGPVARYMTSGRAI